MAKLFENLHFHSCSNSLIDGTFENGVVRKNAEKTQLVITILYYIIIGHFQRLGIVQRFDRNILFVIPRRYLGELCGLFIL